MSEHKRIIEIGGVKIEVDLRTAKKVDHYRVGDRCKVLIKRYGDNYEVYQGIIAAFDDFKRLPTITVCYIEKGYNSAELKFAHINSNTGKDIEITPCDDDIFIEKGYILDRIQADIDKKEEEIVDLKRKRNYFDKMFAQWFTVQDDEHDECGE